MGHFFHKKSLNIWVPFSTKISPLLNMVCFSKISKNFGCLHCEHPKIVKDGCIFQEKSLKIGTFFSNKVTLKNGYGFQARAVHTCPNQIRVLYPWDWLLPIQIPVWTFCWVPCTPFPCWNVGLWHRSIFCWYRPMQNIGLNAKHSYGILVISKLCDFSLNRLSYDTFYGVDCKFGKVIE